MNMRAINTNPGIHTDYPRRRHKQHCSWKWIGVKLVCGNRGPARRWVGWATTSARKRHCTPRQWNLSPQKEDLISKKKKTIKRQQSMLNFHHFRNSCRSRKFQGMRVQKRSGALYSGRPCAHKQSIHFTYAPTPSRFSKNLSQGSWSSFFICTVLIYLNGAGIQGNGPPNCSV